MREVGRAKLGYFRTQDRVTRFIGDLLKPPANGLVTLADAQAGKGDALVPLSDRWRSDGLTVNPFGVESEKLRAAAADSAFRERGGFCIWGNTEDCSVVHGCSLLWYNPNYDTVRTYGRTETMLLEPSLEWVARGGIVVVIVQEKTARSKDGGLPVALDAACEVLGCWQYPDPERDEFGQCVIIARRRRQDKVYDYWADSPPWMTAEWPVLGTTRKQFDVPAAQHVPVPIRKKYGTQQVLDAVAKSPLRRSLLHDAMQPPPKMERPLLPLRAGHMALALAGGLCDGAFTDGEGQPFLLKGTLTRETREAKREAVLNEYDRHVADKVTERTVYTLNVRAMRFDGTLESYSSGTGGSLGGHIGEGDGDDDGERDAEAA